MLTFDSPWLLLLLPLPLFVWWLGRSYREQRQAVRAPFFDEVVRLSNQTPMRGAVVLRRNVLQKLLVPLVWILLVTALARPELVEDPIEKIESARDLMLAVDLSGSMEARDFTGPSGKKISRLEAVKLVLDDFISRRKGDRIGLIFFGTAAFLQVPFTQDHETARLLLEEAQVRMAGPQTMLGDAIGLAIQLFETSENENRVLVMLTDGNDTGSKVPPPQAARIAAERDVTIHTVAMGDPEAVGEQELDIEALEEIADVTGGEFLHAQTTEELQRNYRILDEIESEEYEALSYRPKKPLFHWPLGAALALTLCYHLAAGLVSLRPNREGAHA